MHPLLYTWLTVVTECICRLYPAKQKVRPENVFELMKEAREAMYKSSAESTDVPDLDHVPKAGGFDQEIEDNLTS